MLLAQHHEVVALDVIPEKVALLNDKKSPIVDTEIEDFLVNKSLNFVATLYKAEAYRDAENSYLATDAVPGGSMDQLLGHSITYRIAVGPQAGRRR